MWCRDEDVIGCVYVCGGVMVERGGDEGGCHDLCNFFVITARGPFPWKQKSQLYSNNNG